MYDNDWDDDDYFDDFLVVRCLLCSVLTNHDTNLQYPPIMTVPLHPLPLLQNTRYKTVNIYLSIAHKQWPQFQSSKLGRSREAGGKCWRKTALKCTAVNAGRIVNAEVTFYCPVFFELASARCLIDRSLLIKTSATRYCITAKAWAVRPFPIYPGFSQLSLWVSFSYTYYGFRLRNPTLSHTKPDC